MKFTLNEEISKTKAKKIMHDIQDLGVKLSKLETKQLEKMDLPNDLLKALLECKRIKSREALRRQYQYVGKLMRKIEDLSYIKDKIDEMEGKSIEIIQLFHDCEIWRDKLINEINAYNDFIKKYPLVNKDELKSLLDNYKNNKERLNIAKSYYTKLFKFIKTIVMEDK